jgi:hypothetical protein
MFILNKYNTQFTTLLPRYANTTIYYAPSSLRKYYNLT